MAASVETGSAGFVDISTTSALLFVVIASGFLVMLYKLMSVWFIDILVVLFCIGGAEVSTAYTFSYIFYNIFYHWSERHLIYDFY